MAGDDVAERLRHPATRRLDPRVGGDVGDRIIRPANVSLLCEPCLQDAQETLTLSAERSMASGAFSADRTAKTLSWPSIGPIPPIDQ